MLAIHAKWQNYYQIAEMFHLSALQIQQVQHVRLEQACPVVGTEVPDSLN